MRILYIIILFTLTCCKTPQNEVDIKSKIIGKSIEELDKIKELKDYSYSGIIDIGSKDFFIGKLFLNRNNPNYILLQQKQSEKLYKIIDVLDLTTKEYDILNNDEFVFYTSVCYRQNIFNPKIMAIAKHNWELEEKEQEFYTKINKAWKVSIDDKKIIEIPLKGVKVENEEYYYP